MRRLLPLIALLILPYTANALTEDAGDPWETIPTGGETACSDGSDYLFHVKRGDPSKLFVFLNGGGACWSPQTCNIPETGRPTYVPRADVAHNDPRSRAGVFNLDMATNPVKDWTMVFVPYCTGDVHLGAAVRSYQKEDGTSQTIHHAGAANVKAVFDWIGKTQSPERIVVSGASAGALASPVYAGTAQAMFPDAQIIQYAGGAAGYRSPNAQKLMAQWNVAAALPAERYNGFEAEAASFYSVYEVEARHGPDIQFSLYDTADDQVQVMFRKLTADKGTLANAIKATYSDLEDSNIPAATFLAEGDEHTILRFDWFYTKTAGGHSFADWFARLIESEKPAAVQP